MAENWPKIEDSAFLENSDIKNIDENQNNKFDKGEIKKTSDEYHEFIKKHGDVVLKNKSAAEKNSKIFDLIDNTDASLDNLNKLIIWLEKDLVWEKTENKKENLNLVEDLDEIQQAASDALDFDNANNSEIDSEIDKSWAWKALIKKFWEWFKETIKWLMNLPFWIWDFIKGIFWVSGKEFSNKAAELVKNFSEWKKWDSIDLAKIIEWKQGKDFSKIDKVLNLNFWENTKDIAKNTFSELTKYNNWILKYWKEVSWKEWDSLVTMKSEAVNITSAIYIREEMNKDSGWDIFNLEWKMEWAMDSLMEKDFDWAVNKIKDWIDFDKLKKFSETHETVRVVMIDPTNKKDLVVNFFRTKELLKLENEWNKDE